MTSTPTSTPTSMFTYQQLQDEHAPWMLYNFGAHDPSHPLRGIVEEFGELNDATDVDAVRDALADIVIFTADYCTTKGWSLEKVMAEAHIAARPPWKPLDPERFVIRHLGRLCHADLKSEQKIRVNEDHVADGQIALANLMAFCLVFARSWDIDLLEAVEETWAEVKTRDWKRNASTGGDGEGLPVAGALKNILDRMAETNKIYMDSVARLIEEKNERIDQLRRMLREQHAVVDTKVALKKVADLINDRVGELADRIAEPGPKASHVSASELMEVSDAVRDVRTILLSLAEVP